MTIVNRISRQALAVLVVLLCAFVPVCAKTSPSTIYQTIECDNKYKDAFAVIVIDTDTGCAYDSYGVDCSGHYWHKALLVHPVSSNPDLLFTNHYEGIGDHGGTWSVNADIEDGNLVGLWGQNEQGGYYVVELTNAA